MNTDSSDLAAAELIRAIPTGWNHSAQGCAVRAGRANCATLGNQSVIYPERVASYPDITDKTPLGYKLFWVVTRRSRSATNRLETSTPGWMIWTPLVFRADGMAATVQCWQRAAGHRCEQWEIINPAGGPAGLENLISLNFTWTRTSRWAISRPSRI